MLMHAYAPSPFPIIMHKPFRDPPPPPGQGRRSKGEVESPTKFSKRGEGLDGASTFRGG